MEQSDTLGSKPSIVEDFRIEGLYGYRSIGLSSKYAATILIAKNGSGKTTLLGALDAFLRGHFSRLSNLQFSSITCKLRGVDELLILKQEDIAAYMSLPEVSEIHIASKKFEIEVFALLDFLENEYLSIKGDIRALRENEVFDAIRIKLGYSTPETRRVCERLVTSLAGRNENIDGLRNVLNSVIGETEIVYLPTYRRIELPLQSDLEDSTRNSPRRKRTIQSRLGISKRSLFNADIQFGLSDISERLYNLNQEILYNSNQGYREISANIINELIGGILDNGNPSPVQRPDKESLNLFFSRIREGQYHAPYSDVAIPDIDKIYSGEDISQESNKFLTYFLSKLNTVIQATRDIEVLVEEFINNCNRYLSAQDDSTSIHSDEATAQSKSTSIDGKF
ncbi:ATP-binding protein [Herbaspirillum seropedicae]|uniref:ATP-binding protein n=1 Tax=Herbaspirillum seropedicae TaxID=964 RepID=UPI0008639CAA|nr:ATP-binding protein [Herbaspirillum seropedicae]AON55794.1 hypothetical protein Hsc_3528 [Herbaspirillum seropedicae]